MVYTEVQCDAFRGRFGVEFVVNVTMFVDVQFDVKYW